MEAIEDKWAVEEDQVLEYELNDNTRIRYYMSEGRYIAEWEDILDGEEYTMFLPSKFIELNINKVPLTWEDFNKFKKIVEKEVGDNG
jgi:hypothetical protein